MDDSHRRAAESAATTKTDSNGKAHHIGRPAAGGFTRDLEAGVRAAGALDEAERRRARNRRKRLRAA